ncbi:MAG: T9SS type A sorting domain-containing protein, partial [Bacteroidetes bacterium]|nr:T9SS type A sorting domain-containing protein [Bacteroidota bacterium]
VLRFDNKGNLPVEVNMFDASGRLALNAVSNGYIDIIGLERGLYILQIRSKHNIKTARVILN